ncbi:MAG: hypothetical protein IJA22_01710, partial [Clostridia bacterium]|nr:hypothetical protein [Clostridia bacterium]
RWGEPLSDKRRSRWRWPLQLSGLSARELALLTSGLQIQSSWRAQCSCTSYANTALRPHCN